MTDAATKNLAPLAETTINDFVRDGAVAIEVEHPLARMNDEERLGGAHRFENLPPCFKLAEIGDGVSELD